VDSSSSSISRMQMQCGYLPSLSADYFLPLPLLPLLLLLLLLLLLVKIQPINHNLGIHMERIGSISEQSAESDERAIDQLIIRQLSGA
jgi:hypothetical protein